MNEETCNRTDCKRPLTIKIFDGEDTIHYGKRTCEKGHFNGFVKKEENEGKRTKTSKHTLTEVVLFYKLQKPFCFFCSKFEQELAKYEVMELDHIWELQKGGGDTLTNLQILCTGCHKLKNWRQLYTNWHFKK